MLDLEEKRRWIEKENQALSIKAQCQLIGMPRASYYYEPAKPKEIELILMRRIDEIYTQSPFYGSRKMVIELKKEGHDVNRKKMQRLMRLMGVRRDATGAKHLKKASRKQNIPLSIEEFRNSGAFASVEYRYHFHSTTNGICLFGCRDGLVQQTGAFTSAFKQSGNNILFRGYRRSLYEAWDPRDFQYGPRSAVHLS